jgi:hypothetical protein
MSTTKKLTPSFIREWDKGNFRCMDIAIKIHFDRRGGADTMHYGHVQYNTFQKWDACFGLAYTSSSKCAMYSICNTEVYFDVERKYKYEYFAIGKDGYYYAILQDKEENELIIKL